MEHSVFCSNACFIDDVITLRHFVGKLYFRSRVLVNLPEIVILPQNKKMRLQKKEQDDLMQSSPEVEAEANNNLKSPISKIFCRFLDVFMNNSLDDYKNGLK